MAGKDTNPVEVTEVITDTEKDTKSVKEIKIVTESGFKCSVREDALNDMRILDALIKVDSKRTDAGTKVIKLVMLLNALLGEDQTEDLYDFLVERDGQASSQEVRNLTREIFDKISESKKK